MPTVDSDELINQAIEARRNIEAQRSGIQSQRSTLINQLRSLPGGYRRSHLAASIQAQLHGLDVEERHLEHQERASDIESRTRMSAAFRNAEMADKHLETQRHAQTAEQATKILLGMADIESKYKHGSPEFHDAMVNLVDQNPLGMNAAQARKRVLDASTFHDQETDRVRKIAANDLAKVGLTPEEFASQTNRRRGRVDAATGEFTNQYTGAEKGDTMAFDIGGRTYHAPVAIYDRLDKVLGQPKSDIKAAQPSTPLTPDEQAQAVGYRSAAQVQGYDQGKPLEIPVGTVSTDKTQPLQQPIQPGRLPSGGYYSNVPLPRSTVPQTPEGGREEIQRQTELINQQGVQPPTSTQPAAPTIDHTAAVNWAKANPNDARAKRILELNPQ